MINGFVNNDWNVIGKVYYIKELHGEFACSLRLEGVAKREGVYSSQLLDFACLMQKDVYEDAKRKGLARNREVSLSGHLESWKNSTSKNPKIMFVADSVNKVV